MGNITIPGESLPTNLYKGDTGFGTKTAAVGFLETLRPSDFELFETC